MEIDGWLYCLCNTKSFLCNALSVSFLDRCVPREMQVEEKLIASSFIQLVLAYSQSISFSLFLGFTDPTLPPPNPVTTTPVPIASTTTRPKETPATPETTRVTWTTLKSLTTDKGKC